MNLTPGELLTIAGVLVSAGIQLQTIASLRARVKRLEAGAAGQGVRLGGHDVDIAVLRDRVGLRRRQTSAPVSLEDDDSGAKES